MDQEAGEGEAEDGGYVLEGAVDAGFVEVAAGSFGRGFTFIGEEFVAVDTEEFSLGVAFLLLEALTKGAREWTAGDFPEFGYTDSGGVEFEGGSHGGVEFGFGCGGHLDQEHLVFEGVDGVDYIVVAVEIEAVDGFGGEDLFSCVDVGVGIDSKQIFFQGLDFYATDGLGSSHQLTVYVGVADTVAVNDRDIRHACTHEALDTPGSDAANAENYYFCAF